MFFIVCKRDTGSRGRTDTPEGTGFWVRRVCQFRHTGIIIVERKTGFEPATPTLARWCSTTELRSHKEYPICRLHDLNTRPSDYKSDALPAELNRLIFEFDCGSNPKAWGCELKLHMPTTAFLRKYRKTLVELMGLKPTTPWMQIRCSINWATTPKLIF